MGEDSTGTPVAGHIDGGSAISEAEEGTSAVNPSPPGAAAAVIAAASAMEHAIRDQAQSDLSPREPSFISDSVQSETVGDGETDNEADRTQGIFETEIQDGKETTKTNKDVVCSCCGEIDCDADFQCKGDKRSLIIVNTLPFQAAKKDGSWALQDVPSHTSHLYHCLLGSHNAIWMGSIAVGKQNHEDNHLSDEDKNELRGLLQNKNCIPVFIEHKQLQNWKEYCNDILRPLFYYSSLNLTHSQEVQILFDDYIKTSVDFKNEVTKIAKKGDTILVYDYHLMLLPMYLCSSPKKRIGWFCHSPFPASDVLKMLPTVAMLLEGVLHTNVIGFSTVNYRKQFIDSCKQVLHAEVSEDYTLEYEKKMTTVQVLPLGIDVHRVHLALEHQSFRSELAKIADKFQGKKVILSVDETEESFGIREKLLAFESFLASNESWHDKVIFVLIYLSSEAPGSIEQSAFHDLAKKINREYHSLSLPPIFLEDKMDLTLGGLCAYYSVADLFLCTPLRDGISGSCLEFLAAHYNKAQVIVSQFTAVAQYITDISMAINPRDIGEFACLIKSRLEGNTNGIVRDLDYTDLIFRPGKWMEEFLELLWWVPTFDTFEEREHYTLGQLHGKVSKKVLAFKLESLWKKVVFTRKELVKILERDFEEKIVKRYLTLDTGLKVGDSLFSQIKAEYSDDRARDLLQRFARVDDV